MSEQKWTPEDQWELLDWGHSCTLRIGEAYAGLPYEHPYGRGRCEKQMANGRRLIQCVKACKDMADPAAELARLREVEAKVDKLEADLYLAGENTKSDQAYILNLGIENARLREENEALLELSEDWDATCTILAAELTKHRTVYAAAVEECRVKRQSPHISKPGPHFKQEFAHDTARAEAGMENL